MKLPVLAVACALAAFPLASCGLTESNTKDDDTAATVAVDATDDACEVSPDEAPSGTVSFTVTNNGSKVTEFYLYREDGEAIVGEVENIGPGISRDLVVTVGPGEYVTACKPGMVGDGIRGTFTVTDSGKAIDPASIDAAMADQAIDQYADYVADEAGDLAHLTQDFVAAYKSGKDDEARALYATARTHWERIEPVAESFGDLDPRLDLREADLEAGQEWTGWHRIEKDLWPPAKGYTPLTDAERATLADQLLADTEELHSRVGEVDYTLTQIANGAKELMDEIATGKITGEEEIWSHTDLYDFQANVDGAHEAFEALEAILSAKDHDLVEEIEEGFDDLQSLLEQYRRGEGFVSYDKVTAAQRKELSDAVNALAEPLSKVAGAIVS